MKKFAFATIALGVLAGIAHAGQKSEHFVYVGEGHAQGAMGSARNSPNSIEQLGCWVSGGPGWRSVQCYAVDRDGNWASCYGSDPDIVSAGAALTSEGNVIFNFEPKTAECTYLNAGSWSWTPPKAP